MKSFSYCFVAVSGSPVLRLNLYKEQGLNKLVPLLNSLFDFPLQKEHFKISLVK